ncbi:SpoIVB peptidase [Roseburia hominis]|uniref:SpoIVB peptidase n=1 Tax=Roseburia hominis TaxID=301301 RepID=UPI001F478B2E|nr:SpoIVB peptidase [Roseburia hominis]
MLIKVQRAIQKMAKFGMFLLIFFSYYTLQNEIPSKINVVAGKTEQFDFKVPVTFSAKSDEAEVFDNLAPKMQGDEVTIHTNDVCKISNTCDESTTMVCKLFGVLPIKEVSLQVVPEQSVVPGGEPIGIYVQTDGVLAIGTGNVTGFDGVKKEPAASLIKSGDYICAVNGEEIETKEQLVEKVNQYGADKIDLYVRRNEEYIDVFVTPVLAKEGGYKLGIWVRDDLAGIGTMTYVSDDLSYAALGHGVNDADTSSLLEMKDGSLYQTTIVDIVKGENGTPGELTGVINYRKEYYLGSVTSNSEVGIAGKLDALPVSMQENKSIPVGLKQEIQPGDAEIICNLNGERKAYTILINEVNYSDTRDKREIVFTVTDEELLSATGGIVQGMSGAPIIQNGKIIGAVTHVYINDPTKGYGIFIEEMLND